MTNDPYDSTDDSRRSLAKRGTVAAGALALGTGALAGTAATQDDEEEVVIFTEDYIPGADFDVVGELEQGSTIDILQSFDVTEETVVDDPSDWDSYIIQYDIDADAGILAVLFTEEVELSVGDSETMSEDAGFRNSRLSAVEVNLD
jgi:hypothetical protein